jgi:SAM-dependent methyltransferase
MIPSEPLLDKSLQVCTNPALEHWLSTPAGQYVLQWEQPWLEAAVSDVFGYHAVQLGLPHVSFLANSRMPNRWIVSQQAEPVGLCMHSIVSEFEELPFASQSVDLVVAPHLLEFSSDPHQVLREIDRILIPEGRLFVTGLNPLSLWGVRQMVLKRWHPVWPVQAHPIGVPRLRDLLKLLSFETEMGRFGCYRWPSQNESRLQGGAFMEKAGDRWWPMCGAAYFLGAVKRVRKMTLIGPRWKTNSVAALTAAARNPSGAASQPVNKQQ